MRVLATDLGGACLSSEYFSDKTVLTWRCAKRHRFEYPALAVKSGAWCPTCRPPPRLREIHVPDRVAIQCAKKEARIAQRKVSAAERVASRLAPLFMLMSTELPRIEFFRMSQWRVPYALRPGIFDLESETNPEWH
jgi:hypothetical protein